MKQISFLVLLIMVISFILPACAGESVLKDSQTTIRSDQDSETTEKDARQAISDGLPEINYDGKQFRIYSSSGREETFYTDEQDGEVINDAIFDAVRTTEERFNVDIINIDSGGDDVVHSEKIRSTITGGDDAFEIAENHDSLSGTIAVQGLLLNLYDIPHLDYSKPWWPSNAVESLTYRNQMYLASSNINYRGFHWTRVLFFNKDLIVDYNMEEPYTYVFNGTWTLDRFISMTKDVYEDLNGNSKSDPEDLYGYVAKGPIYCYLEQYALKPVIKTDEGDLELGINNERTITLIEKMYTLMHESKGGLIGDYTTAETLFGSDRALFAFGQIGDAVDRYRYTEVNYGIVMQPKLNESQQEYYAEYTDRFLLFPITTQNTEFSGVIFEAMSAEGYKQIFPAYYEIALKQKFTYDNESVQVLDIINDVRVLDFSYVYCADINGMINTLLYNNPSKDFVSLYKKNEKSITTKLNQIKTSYEKLEANSSN